MAVGAGASPEGNTPPLQRSLAAIEAIPPSKARKHIEILAHRLDIEGDPSSSLNTFAVNPDGTLPDDVAEALRGIKRKGGYSIYEVVITNLDTEYARAMMSAGLKTQGGITDPYMLSHIEDAHSLYEYNLQSIRHNGVVINDETFENVVVAQAKTDKVNEIGKWNIPDRAGFWTTNEDGIRLRKLINNHQEDPEGQGNPSAGSTTPPANSDK